MKTTCGSPPTRRTPQRQEPRRETRSGGPTPATPSGSTLPKALERGRPLLSQGAKATGQGMHMGIRRKRPPSFSGTTLVLMKHNFEIDVEVQLEANKPNPTRTIVDTGAGPSIVREDSLPASWGAHATRAPKSNKVCDASGRLLNARGRVSWQKFRIASE